MKCAEVICESFDDFSIVCAFCNLKTLEFGEFLQHFKNVHANEDKKDRLRLPTNCEITVTTTTLDNCDNTQPEFQAKGVQRNNIGSIAEPKKRESADDDPNPPMAIMNLKSGSTTDLLTSNDTEYTTETSTVSMNSTGTTLTATAQNTTQEITNLKCAIYNKECKSIRTLESHKQRAHKILPSGYVVSYKCQFCTENYGILRLLHAHALNAHHGFPCDKCFKVFGSEEALQHHMPTHITFVCDVENCNVSFLNENKLNRHKRKIHGHVLNQYQELVSPTNIHGPDNAPAASVEQIQSPNHSDSLSVQAADTTVSKLSDILACDNCNKVCECEKVLQRHISIPKLCVCDVENCKMSFRTEKTLNKHKRNEHQIYVKQIISIPELFVCDVENCKMKCRTEKKLKNHKQYVHQSHLKRTMISAVPVRVENATAASVDSDLSSVQAADTADDEPNPPIAIKNLKAESTTDLMRSNDTEFEPETRSTTELASSTETELKTASQTQMDHIAQTETSTVPMNFTDTTQTANAHYTIEIKKRFLCNLCNKKYWTFGPMESHLLRVHRILSCGNEHAHALNTHHCFACDKCVKMFRSENGLQRHMAIQHRAIVSPTIISIPTRFVCDVENCKLSFSKLKKLNNHKRNIHQSHLKRTMFSAVPVRDENATGASVDQMSSSNHSDLSSVQATDTATMLGDILSNQQILLDRLMSVDSGIKGINTDMQLLIDARHFNT